jgi:hypothetical protein
LHTNSQNHLHDRTVATYSASWSFYSCNFVEFRRKQFCGLANLYTLIHRTIYTTVLSQHILLPGVFTAVNLWCLEREYRVTKVIKYITAEANSRSAAQEMPHLQSSFMRLQRLAMDPFHESDGIRPYPDAVLFKVHLNNIFLCLINGR